MVRYPTPGVPRTADGKPDLTGATPPTADDPKNYTRPWTVMLTQAIVVDTELVDEICLENEKPWERMQAAPQR